MAIWLYCPRESIWFRIRYDHHEAIIDRETFDRVQAIMAQRSVQNESRKKLDSPFAGLIRCGKCGRSVCGHRTPTSRQNGDSRFVTWRCVGKNNGGQCDCKDSHNDELFAAVHSILGHPAEEGLDGVKDILMYDEKLVFELRNGRKMTWRRK